MREVRDRISELSKLSYDAFHQKVFCSAIDATFTAIAKKD